MSEPRSLIMPRAIALGARPLTIPKRGAVLAVSAFYAFRLSDEASVLPADWYETVAGEVGADAIPDSMAPVPGAELMILGSVPPVADRTRRVTVRCGSLLRTVILRRDPDTPDAPFEPGVAAAVWHEDENPVGRGGPDDERPALIVRERNAEQPVWFGTTPFDHPLRLREMGTPDAASGTGWPSDADPAVFYDAHPALWTRSFAPGDPLAFDGLAAAPCDSRLPPYRITITSGREDGRFLVEPARIHTVTLIPSADVGAMFWRVVIDLGDDILGESVQALVAALEDADSPVKDAEHWGRIAVDRWLEPDSALDDRPLLPAALAASVTLPFAMAADDPIKARHADAEEWIKGEVGMGENNPFDELAPEAEAGLADQAIEAADKDDAPPDANEIDGIADRALAASRQRHAEAGFEERSPEQQAAPEVRGPRLETEIFLRLAAPYQSPRDRSIVRAIEAQRLDEMDAADVVEKLASARQINPDPAVAWPALDEEEARRFGEAFCERLDDRDTERHVDVAGVAVAGGRPDGTKRTITDRRLHGLLAEDTTWEGTVFLRCDFEEASFCRAHFKDCEFRECRFHATNLSKAELAECGLVDCTFADMRIVEPTWFDSRFERCSFDDLSLSDVAMRDSVFEGGAWNKVDLADGLLMDMTWRDLAFEEVTFAEVMAPQNRFERVSMTKFWMMSKGPAASVFEDVEADTCGFLGNVRFDQSSFTRVHFSMTGFTSAIFADTVFSEGCRFDRCDLSGAAFLNAQMEGIRFIECSMTGSKWSNVQATNAWFYAALLRGVDFGDTELTAAVFTDADLEGTKFLPDKTIGADFRGTVLADPAD